MLVAVYGTLRFGEGNHVLMNDSTFIGEEWIEGLEMYSAGGFPVVYKTENHDSIVLVEVWEVDEVDVLTRLDPLEGHPQWYRRELIPTQYGMAWLYIMQDERYKENHKIETGNWRAR